MDISKAIKTAIFQALSPAIGVPVYEAFAIPESATYPYVIISSIDANEDLNSKCKSFRVNVLIDIVTGYSSPKGSNAALDISESVENIINPNSRNYIDMTSLGYQIGQVRSNSQMVQLRTDNYWIYRALKSYDMIVWNA